MKKYNENILVFPTSLLEHLPEINPVNDEDCEEILEAILEEGKASFMDRNLAETDPNFKQVIPYVVLRYKDPEHFDPEYLVFRRGKTGGEGRLHGKYSLGVAGHITDEDGPTPSEAFYQGMIREIEEEFEVELDMSSSSPYPDFVINDDSDEVGKVHFGLVYIIDVASPFGKPKEECMESPRFMTWQEIHDTYEDPYTEPFDTEDDHPKLENWSSLILEHLD